MKIKPCLFDMDGTVADHDAAFLRDYAAIQSPTDPPVVNWGEDEPEWLKNRKTLIRSQRNWWLNLPEIKLGFDVYEEARKIGFQINILTKGPWTCDHAWTEKVQWVRKHMYDDTKITITEDKSITYGRVLVDDYVPYVMGWLQHRPRGVVIMVAHERNADIIGEGEKYVAKNEGHIYALSQLKKAFGEGRIVRYDGTNFDSVVVTLKWAYNR